MAQNWENDFSTNEMKKACVHEAGHIIVAVAMGYTINNVCVDENGFGKTSISYGNDLDLAKVFNAVDAKKICEKSGTDAFGEFVTKYIPILLAGHSAEFLFESKFETKDEASICFDGKDSHDIKELMRILQNDFKGLSVISTTLIRDNQMMLENIAKKLYEQKNLNSFEITSLTQGMNNNFKQ